MCDATHRITRKSLSNHKEKSHVIDLLIVLIGVLLAVLFGATAYAVVQYRKQLLKAQKEYEKARDSVEDIVLSFNRELKREAERIQTVAYKAEEGIVLADSGLRKVEHIERRLAPIENQLTSFTEQTAKLYSVMESNTQTLEKVTNVDTKLKDIEASQGTLQTKIAGLEEQMQKLSAIPEENVEPTQTLPVMPIKRDKAMASLTDTEVAVLEYLSAEGPKTAPEIKEKVGLSREHTARLMKKLYEEGYLERETGKLPFKYSVKSEMAKLLKKPEAPPPA